MTGVIWCEVCVDCPSLLAQRAFISVYLSSKYLLISIVPFCLPISLPAIPPGWCVYIHVSSPLIAPRHEKPLTRRLSS